MYRELGAPSRALGMAGGPYAGAARVLRLDDLPPTVRARLRAVFEGTKPPSLLARVPATRDRSALFYGVGAVFAVLAIVIAFVGRYGAENVWRIGLIARTFAICGGAFLGAGLAALIYKSVRGVAFEGMAILPLDLIQIQGQSLRVTPFGSLRNARVTPTGMRATLTLIFDDGSEHILELASEAAAEALYRSVEAAQSQIEQLTIATDLERALAIDPFFEIRDTPSFLTQSTSRKARFTNAQMATLIGALSGAILILGGSKIRDRFSERALLARLYMYAADDAWQAYADHGGDPVLARREQSLLHDRQLERSATKSAGVQLRDDVDRNTFAPALADTPDHDLRPAAMEARTRWQEATVRTLRANQADPRFVAVMEAVFSQTRELGERRFGIFVRHPAESARSGAPTGPEPSEKNEDGRDKQLGDDFAVEDTKLVSEIAERLRETIPDTLLWVVRVPPESERLARLGWTRPFHCIGARATEVVQNPVAQPTEIPCIYLTLRTDAAKKNRVAGSDEGGTALRVAGSDEGGTALRVAGSDEGGTALRVAGSDEGGTALRVAIAAAGHTKHPWVELDVRSRLPGEDATPSTAQTVARWLVPGSKPADASVTY